MSALVITTQTLLAGAEITAMVGTRVYPVFVPPDAAYPNIAVHLVHQAEETLLPGPSEFPEARVMIECRSRRGILEADEIAEKVIAWLRDKHLYVVDNSHATFRKEGTDETDASDTVNQNGFPDVVRRFFDFYVRYRRVD